MNIGYYCAIFPFCGGVKKEDDKKTKAFHDWATTGIPVITSRLAYREWYVARTNRIFCGMYLAPIRSPH